MSYDMEIIALPGHDDVDIIVDKWAPRDRMYAFVNPVTNRLTVTVNNFDPLRDMDVINLLVEKERVKKALR